MFRQRVSYLVKLVKIKQKKQDLETITNMRKQLLWSKWPQ